MAEAYDRSIGQERTQHVSGVVFSEEPAGRRIGGHYEIDALIGRGGMGAVYRCRDVQLGRAVAVKRILPGGAGGEAGLERFRREAHVVASLNHRNIVIVHEFAEEANGPYLVMELLEGADLGAWVATHGALPVADVIDVATQAGSAFSYAHRRGIVHRDIKPTNLFRLKDRTVKVLDFGLARVGTDSQLSVEGFGLGTVDYVSPEQRRDATRVDHRSDLFSLGATLYYLATGRAPRLVRERDLPDELRAVVLALMEDRPEDRPFSVHEALAPLQTAAKSADPPSSATFRQTIDEATCPACGARNPFDARFCQDCGSGLFETCPACQTEVGAGRKYCAKCGTALHLDRPVESAPTPPAASPTIDGGTINSVAEPARSAVGSPSARRLVDPTKSSILSLCFSPDARWLISGGLRQSDVDSGTASLWETPTGELVRTFVEPGLSFTSVEFSPDGRWLALAATCGSPLDSCKEKRNSLILWNPSRPQEMRRLEGHPGQVFCVKFSPDSRLLAATNGTNVVTLWEVSSGRKVRMLDAGRGAMGFAGNLMRGALQALHAVAGSTGDWGCTLAFSADGLWLATADVLGVAVCSVSSGTSMNILSGGLDLPALAFVAFSDGDNSLIEVRRGGKVTIWDWAKGTQRNIYKYPEFIYAALSPSNKFLATAAGGERDPIELWEMIGGRRVRTLVDSAGLFPPGALVFSPDGNWLAAAGFGGQITINSTSDLQ